MSTPDADGAGTVSAAPPDAIPVGASVVFTLVVRVDTGAADGTILSDPASVSVDTSDPDPDNDDTSTTTVRSSSPSASSADLVVTQRGRAGTRRRRLRPDRRTQPR